MMPLECIHASDVLTQETARRLLKLLAPLGVQLRSRSVSRRAYRNIAITQQTKQHKTGQEKNESASVLPLFVSSAEKDKEAGGRSGRHVERQQANSAQALAGKRKQAELSYNGEE